MAGITAIYISATTFTITGDQTAVYNTGRRIKAVCSSVNKYGTVVSSAYTSLTTVILTATSDDLNSGLTEVYYGIQADGIGSMPEHAHDTTEGEGGTIPITNLSDTPAAYDTGKFLRSTTSGTEWASGAGGTSVHSELSNLAYATAGHTGFSPDTHIHDDRYYTETEVDTISGTLQTDIDTKLENVSDDLSPELGGDLSCNDYNLDDVGRLCSLNLSTKVYNDNGFTLTKGTAVTISGLHNEVCTVTIADNRETGKMPCCGIIFSDIAAGAEGCGIRLGRINMDTSGMAGSVKDRLYIQSDGSLDTVIPSSGMVQRVGFLVVKAAGSAGRICVCLRGPRSMYSAKDQHPIVRMGDDAGHKKMVFKDYTDNEIAAFDSLGNLTLSGTVDGIDIATHVSNSDAHHNESHTIASHSDTSGTGAELDTLTDGSETALHKHDDRYYTESEVDTISGSLQTNIDGKSNTGHIHDGRYYTESEVDTISGSLNTKIDTKATTLLELSDTPVAYDDNKYLKSTSDGTEWATVSGGTGTSAHSELTELDYASAGHTGFSPDTHTHDDRYYTESEIDTISGSLSSEIDSDISTHTSNSDAHHNESHTVVSHSDTSATGSQLDTLVGSGDTTLHKHDTLYYTESEVDTISGSLQTNINGKSDTGHTHDGRYYTESEVDTISGSLNTSIGEKIGNIVEDTTPQLGGTLEINEKSILIDAALSSDHTWTGQTQSITAGENLAIFETAYLKSDGKYWKTNATAEATSDSKVVMATAAISADATGIALLSSDLSFIRDDSTTEWTFTTIGKPIFLSKTAGDLTNDISGYTTGNIGRVAGYMETVTILNFNVDKVWVKI